MMEENSEAHMETDVSSTTDDVPETQKVTGSNVDVEMVIVVEKVKDEEDGSIDTKHEEPLEPEISSPSTSTETSSQKEPLLQNEVNKLPVKENNPSKLSVKSPISCDSQKISNKISQDSFNVMTSSTKQQLESSDSSIMVETKISPVKSVEKPCESSPIKISKTQKVIHKSPFKDTKSISKSPIKLIRMHPKPKNNDIKIQEINAIKIIHEKPDKEVNQLKSSNGEEKYSEKSPKKIVNQENFNKQIMLHEISQNKEAQLQENSVKEVQDKSPTKEKLVEPASNIIGNLVEHSKKDDNSVKNTSTENRSDDCNTNTQSKDASMSDNSIAKSTALDLNIDMPEKETTKTVKETNLTENASTPTNVTNDILSTSDISDKEHNKSISRELRSLINSAKESKIISECTQLTSKTRKSRTQLDTSNTSLNVSLEADKVGGVRRGSANSQVSNSSEKSERSILKRSMRSQNPEFVNKCKQFLNSVTAKVMKDSDEAMSEDETNTNSTHSGVMNSTATPSPKKKKVSDQPVFDEKANRLRSDAYCWRCHWTVEQEENDKSHPPMQCTVCPRSYHFKCLSTNERKTVADKKWVCPDCLQVLHAEGSDTRSPGMKKISLGMLCDLLKYALERMMNLNGVEPFMNPVDRSAFPDYDKYVVHPMCLSQMKQNIADGLYGSAEAFMADAQWILHNSIIFNTCEQAFLQSKLTGGARALVRSCRAEMGEIEACHECYAAAHERRPTWFTDVCTTPHILLWAKLKGFPYWPAKGMTVNSSGLVDVRFFGAHDRAWVPAKDCFLFSEKDPNNFRSKRQDILDSMQEAEQHIRNISRKYGKFVYPPFKTQFDPSRLGEQLKMMIPSFEGEIRAPVKDKSVGASPLAKEKRSSNSKSSKGSANDGDISENEEMSLTATIKHDKDNTEKKPKVDSFVTTVIPPVLEVPSIATRKRRRSNLEEAVMTVIETGVPEKKKRINSTEQKKNDQQQSSSSKEEKAQLITKADVIVSTSKKKTDSPKGSSKDEEPSSSTMEEKESLRVTPIKLVALPRPNKQTPKMFAATKVPSKPNTPKEEEKTPQRPKSARIEKPSTAEKANEDKSKSQKRRNSKANKSLNSTLTPKAVKAPEKKTESGGESTGGKELRPREKKKDNDGEANKSTATNSLLIPIDSPKPKAGDGAKPRTGDTSKPRTESPKARAADGPKSRTTDSPKPTKDRIQFDDDTNLAVLARERRHPAGLPTISSVCSLSAPAPALGRVGVRAFARMTSPPPPERAVSVEIKAEPVDLDEDEERHNEKMDLMAACRLRPVGAPPAPAPAAAPAAGPRDVRVGRVMLSAAAAVRPRAKKTFPSPRRADDARSELNGKNSMVYIPIQPPHTQAPRAPRPPAPALRPAAPTSSGNNTVNTVTTPLKPTTSTLSTPPSSGGMTVLTSGQVPTVGQVPTTVHTVPLMTSVNGQWMFSLQPVMSVGGVDNSTTSPMVNGVTDRGGAPPALPSVLPPALPLSATATPNAASSPAHANRTANDNNTPAELPRLQQRPPLQNPFEASGTPPAPAAPSSAGPLTARLNQNAVKLADFFRTLLEDSIEKLDEPGAATALRMQLEQARWRHQQELDELKHNHELTLSEMRLSFEKDKLRVIAETRRAAAAETDAAVKLAKSKQWCANCAHEAQFYCCWNTAYCDYPCQRAHWPQHFASCAQRPKDGNEDDTNPPESRLQPQPDNLPKSAPAQTPALTVGGKPGGARVFTSDAAAQKTSIIVSMVEDNSGNQTMKCVGTYKPGQSPGAGQMSPLILNKQVINDESGKKVVTSGGYLIVGASGNSASVITPAPTRRPHTIQYFT